MGFCSVQAFGAVAFVHIKHLSSGMEQCQVTLALLLPALRSWAKMLPPAPVAVEDMPLPSLQT